MRNQRRQIHRDAVEWRLPGAGGRRRGGELLSGDRVSVWEGEIFGKSC